MQRYPTVDALVAAIDQRRQADRTTEVERIGRQTGGGTSTRVNGRSWVLRDACGAVAAARRLQQEQDNSPLAMLTELVVVGDDAWVRLDQRVRRDTERPWLRIDPAGGDVNSLYFASQIAGLRRDRPIDLLGAGRASVVDAELDPVDGAQAMRYTLRVDLDGSGEDVATGEQLRQRGVSSVRPIVHLDADDRVLRYRVDVALPGDGRYLVRERTLAHGGPVTITPPPADQVAEPPR